MAKIILIGDSIRMGYAPFVKETLQSEHELWEPEMNGGTSCRVLEHLKEWVIAQQPDLVHLNAGLHDMKRQVDDPHQPITDKFPPVNTPEQYRANLKEIVSRIQSETSATLILALTTPVLEHRQVESGKNPQRRTVDIATYNKVMREVAADANVATNDLHQVVLDADPEKVMTRDGVHFNEEGSRALAAAVVKSIRKALA